MRCIECHTRIHYLWLVRYREKSMRYYYNLWVYVIGSVICLLSLILVIFSRIYELRVMATRGVLNGEEYFKYLKVSEYAMCGMNDYSFYIIVHIL